MSRARSVKELCEGFWELERRYGLLAWTIDGVYLWQLSRTPLYYEIAKRTGVLDEPHPMGGAGFGEKAKTYLGTLMNHPFLDLSRKTVLVFDHARKVRVGDEVVDLYTTHFLKRLQEQGASYEVYEFPYMGRRLTAREPRRRYLGVPKIVFAWCACAMRFTVTDADRQRVAQLSREVERIFGVTIDLLPFFSRQIREFKVGYAFYHALLRLKRPSKIYVVVSYTYAPLIKAAKDLGIETIEFQHGTFSEYHLGYSFPSGERNLPYFPDRFCVWSDFWKDICRLPLPPERIEVVPFEHLEREKRRLATVKKIPGQLVVISQGAIGNLIADAMLRHIDELKAYRVLYKLHPSEVRRWRQYESLVTLSRHPGVTVLDREGKPLYELLAESPQVIGVFSTALYEALEFGCELLLIDLPGIEYMRRLLDSGRARMLGSRAIHASGA